MTHFRQPEVANSAPSTGQSAYRAIRTTQLLLQLWCFRQFSKQILPLLAGKAAADLAFVNQPALIALAQLEISEAVLMNRREFLQRAGGVVGTLIVGRGALGARGGEPNLLIIQTDEHNFRTLGCYRAVLSRAQALM